MKFSTVLLILSLSSTFAIFGDIGDFFEDLGDIGEDFGNLIASGVTGGWDATSGFFTGDVANFFEPVGDGIVWLGKETGQFFVSSYNWVVYNGAALFAGGAAVIPPTWQCYSETVDNIVFETDVPVRTVKRMLDTDRDPSTPDEEINDVACLTNDDNQCDYGWCGRAGNNAANLADDAPHRACTNFSLWADARSPCVIIYLGKSAEPPTAPCDIDVTNPITGENVKQFEGEACFDGDYTNGDDECFGGQCVATSSICRDDPDWSTIVFNLFPYGCTGFPESQCGMWPDEDGVLPNEACPATCGTCPPGSHVDTGALELREAPKPRSINKSFAYGAGGVALGAAILVAIVKFRRRRSYYRIETQV